MFDPQGQKLFYFLFSLNNVSPPFFSFWDPDNVCILVFMMVPHKFFKFSSLYFILFSFCSSGRITLPCLQVYWSFLHVIWSAVKCLCWIFQFNYYILQLYDFCLHLLSLLLGILILFIHCSSDFGEHLYDYYFEFSIR